MTRARQTPPDLDVTPGRFAFWNYSAYPYLLGGKIGSRPNRADDPGLVYIPSYAKRFRPAFTTDAATGEKLLDQIERLQRLKRAVDAAVQEELEAVRRTRLGDFVPASRLR